MLDAAAAPLTAKYRVIRRSMPAGPERTQELEEVVTRARRMAADGNFDPAEVSRWLREGRVEERITALAMMQARPELRDFDGTLAAIQSPRSAFEQFHALQLALVMIDRLGSVDRERLAAAIETVRGVWFRQPSGRWRLTEHILASLGR